MRYRFTKAINVEQTAYKVGQEVEEKEIPPGSLESLLRTKAIEPIAEKGEPAGGEPKKPQAEQKPQSQPGKK
jgi:hypothetical protein